MPKSTPKYFRKRCQRSLSRAALLVAATLLGISSVPKSQAANNWYWDANNFAAGTGGSGLWDGSSWSTSTRGTDAVSSLEFTADDIAVFTGVAGTVTLNETKVVGVWYLLGV